MCAIKKIAAVSDAPRKYCRACVVPAFDEVLPSFDRECQLWGSVVNLGAIIVILETWFLVGFVAGISENVRHPGPPLPERTPPFTLPAGALRAPARAADTGLVCEACGA